MNKKIKSFIAEVLMSEERETLRYGWVYIMMIIICSVLTIINWVTGYVMLSLVALFFALLCALDYMLCRFNRKAAKVSVILFATEITLLFCALLFLGLPEGFGIIWILLLPSSGMFVFKRRKATVICLVMLFIMILFFWTPAQHLLLYEYTAAFKIRFPVVYIVFFGISFLLETIRSTIFTALERTTDKYEYLYLHDDLTGLLNRHGFNDLVDKAFRDPEVTSMALILVDLDHFKKINDTYGHLKGDAILKEAAELLSKDLKAPIARWGGEEFALLSVDGNVTEKHIYRLCREFENHVFDSADTQIRMTVSVGAAFSDGNVNAVEMFKQADRCLYDAKNRGRNLARICYLGARAKR